MDDSMDDSQQEVREEVAPDDGIEVIYRRPDDEEKARQDGALHEAMSRVRRNEVRARKLRHGS